MELGENDEDVKWEPGGGGGKGGESRLGEVYQERKSQSIGGRDTYQTEIKDVNKLLKEKGDIDIMFGDLKHSDSPLSPYSYTLFLVTHQTACMLR